MSNLNAIHTNTFICLAVKLYGEDMVFTNNLVTHCVTSGKKDYHACVQLSRENKNSGKFH